MENTEVQTGTSEATRLLQEPKALSRASHNIVVMADCPVCGDSFDSDVGMKIHKSKSHGMEETDCVVCGTTVKRSPSRIDNNTVCSDECFYEHQRNQVTTECENCGETLEVKESVFERKEYLFCDRECYKSAWTGEITPHFGKESPWLPNMSGEDHPMYGVRGEDAPGWKEDSIDQNWRKSRKWYRVRKDVLDRDDYECQDCGTGDELNVHHIEPVCDGGDKFSLDNLVTLCREHHYERH